VAQLYRWLDEDFLMTFRELDAYTRGPNAVYWGIWSAGMGEPPNWPPGRGKRIFAYLKPFPALPQLLAALNGIPNPSLVYIPGIDPRLREQFRNPTLRFTDSPVEMSQVARECDLAILNGTHATTVAMLLAAKPALHIPIFLEQAINARAAERLGAAICASPADQKQIANGLRTLLTTDQFSHAAKQFAARYADFNPETQLARILDRAEELATGS
jgi:UDP:flavonoid glycosyltransferase YjiC (YdhE family)